MGTLFYTLYSKSLYSIFYILYSILDIFYYPVACGKTPPPCPCNFYAVPGVQDGPKMAQDGPNMARKWPKHGPAWPQDGPRWRQDGPRWPRDGPDGPRKPQEGPRRPSVAPVFMGPPLLGHSLRLPKTSVSRGP